jgi:hypothetical protein
MNSIISNEFLEAGTTCKGDVTNDGRARTNDRFEVAITTVLY